MNKQQQQHEEVETQYGDSAVEDPIVTTGSDSSPLVHFANRNFKSMAQEQLVDATLADQNVLGVLPTGGGKTMACWVGLASSQPGLTVVVYPLVALMSDQVSRLQLLFPASSPNGKQWTTWNAQEWASGTVAARTKLLLVDVCTARTPAFLGMLKKSTALRRIVFDECSMYLECSFRKGFNSLPLLMRSIVSAPFVLLSGTVPPAKEGALLRACGLMETTIIRQPTVRQNLVFKVKCVDDNSAKRDVVASILTDQVLVESTSSLAIVFVMSKKEGTELQASLRVKLGNVVGFHHSDLLASQRKAVTSEWKNGLSPVLIATSGFAYGIDLPNVRCIVHVGGSFSLAEYAQAAGRAGRDGSLATSTVVCTEQEMRRMGCPELGSLLLNEIVCRRVSLSKVLDGLELSNKFGNCGQCEICAKTNSPIRNLPEETIRHMCTVTDVTTKQPSAAQRVKLAEACVNTAKKLRQMRCDNSCIFCFALHGETGKRHGMMQCPLWKSRCFRCGVANARHKSTDCTMPTMLGPALRAGHHCVTCALPIFAFGATVHQHEGSMGKGCQLKDTVLPLVLLLRATRKKWVTNFAGILAIDDDIKYASWLTTTKDCMTNAGFLVNAWMRREQ